MLKLNKTNPVGPSASVRILTKVESQLSVHTGGSHLPILSPAPRTTIFCSVRTCAAHLPGLECEGGAVANETGHLHLAHAEAATLAACGEPTSGRPQTCDRKRFPIWGRQGVYIVPQRCACVLAS